MKPRPQARTSQPQTLPTDSMKSSAVILSEGVARQRRATDESKDPYDHHKLSGSVILSEARPPRSGYRAESKDLYELPLRLSFIFYLLPFAFVFPHAR